MGDAQLHVWTNGSEFWVETSAVAARAAMNEQHFKGKGTEEELDGEDGEWREFPDDKVLHVESGEADDHCDTHGVGCTARTGGSWASEGPGFLCSVDG